MFATQNYIPTEFLRPIVTGWTAKFEAAKQSANRKRWDEATRECKAFYSGKTGFMWDKKNGSQFWEGIPAPKFRMTMNKAFELVAIFAPSLLFNLPHRHVEPKRVLDLPPELFQIQPQMMAMAQQFAQQYAMELTQDKAIASMMESWLNYTVRETPGGGLLCHAQRALVDGLITGRACLWAKPYQMPGSGRMLTGCFREPPEDLLIDPDFNTLSDAKWIAKRCVHPVWEVERKYKLPPGSLKEKGSLESMWSLGERDGDTDGNMHRSAGKTNDLMVYYEVWSKTGPGTRMTAMNSDIKDQLEAVAGDFCYLVIAPDVPYPLNLPSSMIQNGATDADVKNALQWPIPYWTDDRWPVTILDFYPENDSPYPLPPLAPGLGELKFLNVMISHLANRIWKSSRDFIAIAQSSMDMLKKHLEEGADMTIIPITDLQGDIGKVIQWLQQPQTNFDVWKIIDEVSNIFDKRVGLTELAYGLNPGGTQSRSAEDAAGKRQAFSVRPEFMAKQVEEWMSQAASLEGFCARWFVKGQDVAPLMGPLGAMAWQMVMESTDVERVVRQMSYTIEAGSTRRPNKDRDVANANQAMQIVMPIAAEYAAGTMNYGPLNALINQWGKASDMDTSQLQFAPPPPPPPPPPEADPAQIEAQARQQEAQANAEARQQDLAMREQEHKQKMRHADESHEQKLKQQRAAAAAKPKPQAA